MKQLITALQAKGQQKLAEQIILVLNVEAEVLPDTPERVEKLKTFLRAVRRLQGQDVVKTVKTSLKNVFQTTLLSEKIDSAAEKFTSGALTPQGFCTEIYWHVKHQVHWIITQYEYDPTRFPSDLDIPMLRGIISKF